MHLSEPSQGLPQFFIRGYLDDQPIAHYDSLTRKMEILMPWMEESENETFLALEWVIGAELEIFWFWAVSSGKMGAKEGCCTMAMMGWTSSASIRSVRWVTAHPQAQKVKEKWEEDPGWSERNKVFLEKTCIEGLQRYLSHQKKDPLQKTGGEDAEIICVRKWQPAMIRLLHEEFLLPPKPTQGLTQFHSMVHLDDHLIARYDSPTRRKFLWCPGWRRRR
ncbi:hypothetical protein E2320_014278 [Naja naja]|nr:hypothetical protein E2320_014278 [Naja naja]